MSGAIVLIGVVVLLVLSVALVPIAGARLELRRLRRRYELTDEEVAAYVREFPEVCHAIEASLGGEHSPNEVKRMATDSTISAILRQRMLRPASEPFQVAVDGPLDTPRRGETEGTTGRLRESLSRGKSQRRG